MLSTTFFSYFTFLYLPQILTISRELYIGLNTQQLIFLRQGCHQLPRSKHFTYEHDPWIGKQKQNGTKCKELSNFSIPHLLKYELSVIETCPYYRGVHKKRLDSNLMSNDKLMTSHVQKEPNESGCTLRILGSLFKCFNPLYFQGFFLPIWYFFSLQTCFVYF